MPVVAQDRFKFDPTRSNAIKEQLNIEYSHNFILIRHSKTFDLTSLFEKWFKIKHYLNFVVIKIFYFDC